MNGKITSPATDPDPDPVPERSAPRPQPLPKEVKLPSFDAAMDPSYSRWTRFSWAMFGNSGYGVMLLGLLGTLGEDKKFVQYFVFPFMFLLMVPLFLILFYCCRVSHLMPSKPVGCYAKHGMELIALTYAVIVQWFDPSLCDWVGTLMFVTGINMFVHTMYQLRQNPGDLGWWDFFWVEAMQVAVYTCGGNICAVVATSIVCLMVIGYRFYFYSCLETSDAPVSIVQKFGSEKAC